MKLVITFSDLVEIICVGFIILCCICFCIVDKIKSKKDKKDD